MNGYITTTRKKHYILFTDKRKCTKYMLCSILRKIVETEGIEPEKLKGSLSDRQTLAALRQRIEPCIAEKSGNIWHIEIGSHAILNEPENNVIEVRESRDNALLAEIFGID